MSWPEFMAARQLLTAEGVGKVLRAAQADEDDEFAKTLGMVKAGL
jgi:hypothetical protein